MASSAFRKFAAVSCRLLLFWLILEWIDTTWHTPPRTNESYQNSLEKSPLWTLQVDQTFVLGRIAYLQSNRTLGITFYNLV